MPDTLAAPVVGLAPPRRGAPQAVISPAPTPARAIGDRCFRVIEVLLALAFIGAVLLNFVNVFSRYVLQHSFIGAEEVQTYLMVLMTFFGAAVVAWRGRELRMDVLIAYLPPAGRRRLRGVEGLVMLVCCGFTSWQSSKYAWQMFQLGVHSDGAAIPMWLPHGFVAVGFGLVALVALVRFAQRLTGRHADDERRVLH